MKRKILCPTDFSAHSRAGIACAALLAATTGAELLLFHVTRFPFHELLVPCDAGTAVIEQRLRALAVCRLLREAEAGIRRFVELHFARQFGDLSWRAVAGLGKVPAEILATACREEADLIVMGRRDRPPLQRLFSRSVSEAVSRAAPCPVLTVRPAQVIEPGAGSPTPALAAVLQGSRA
ncbi:MAG TPA: universal stress protein [candidate division Zixibacteria bacterium]|nr:universal stress protein [candidate division Zixibacteria bacterium]